MATTRELFNVDAENALIHAVLTDPTLLDAPELQAVTWSDFWMETNRRTFYLIEWMRREGREIDHIAVADELRRMDVSDADLYADRVMDLITDPALTFNAREYARIVMNWARQREAHNAMVDLGKSFGGDGRFEGALDDALEILTAVKGGRGGALPWEPYTLADAYGYNEATEFAIEGLFEIPSLNIVYGAPGSFKTVLLTEAALCVAAGLPWLEPLPGSGGATARSTAALPALWLDFDNGRKRMHRRVAAIGRARDLDPARIPFSYVCLPTPWLDATDPVAMQSLARYINAGSYGLVVVDNLGTVSGGADENDAAEMAVVFSNFRRVVEATGAAVTIIHHDRKAQANRPGDALRGSTAINAALDLALQSTREPGSDLAQLQSTKVRGADVPAFAALWSYEHKPGTRDLQTARFWGVSVDDTTSDHALRGMILDVVEAMPGINRGDLESELKEHTEAGRDRIRRNITVLVSEGKLETTTGARGAIEHYIS